MGRWTGGRRRAGPALVSLLVTLLVGAAPAGAAGGDRAVVASFYPLAYAAERIGGQRVDVTDLTPAGAEPHDLELSPDQVDEVLDADPRHRPGAGVPARGGGHRGPA